MRPELFPFQPSLSLPLRVRESCSKRASKLCFVGQQKQLQGVFSWFIGAVLWGIQESTVHLLGSQGCVSWGSEQGVAGWSWNQGREWKSKQRGEVRQGELSCVHLRCMPYTLEGNPIGQARNIVNLPQDFWWWVPGLNGHSPVIPSHPSRHSDKFHMKVTGKLSDTVIIMT